MFEKKVFLQNSSTSTYIVTLLGVWRRFCVFCRAPLPAILSSFAAFQRPSSGVYPINMHPLSPIQTRRLYYKHARYITNLSPIQTRLLYYKHAHYIANTPPVFTPPAYRLTNPKISLFKSLFCFVFRKRCVRSNGVLPGSC